MQPARILFILAAIPFTLMALFILLMDMAWNGGKSSSGVLLFFGGVYIYGSIFALRGELPLPLLVVAGALLNVLGAFAWVPAFQYADGALIGLMGAGLCLTWVVTIVQECKAEQH